MVTAGEGLMGKTDETQKDQQEQEEKITISLDHDSPCLLIAIRGNNDRGEHSEEQWPGKKNNY